MAKKMLIGVMDKQELINIKIKDLFNLLKKNTATMFDFDLRYTFECIVTEDGLNEHEDERFSEKYYGKKIWPLIAEIEKLLKETNEK